MLKGGNKMKIGVDLDGVVFDFAKPFIRFYNRLYQLGDDVLNAREWDWWECEGIKITKSQFLDAVKLYCEEGYTYDQPLYLGAKSQLKLLKSMGHELIYVTSRHENVRKETVKSISDNDLPIDGIIFCDSKEKADVCKSLGINIVIEDRPSTVLQYAESDIDVAFRLYHINEDDWNRIQLTHKDLLGRIHPVCNLREFVDFVRDSSVQEGQEVRS
jgi:uncharacterized HAD superfamily protein